MPDPQTLKSGQDVTALMSGQDVTALMGGAPAAPAAQPAEDEPMWKKVGRGLISGVVDAVNPLPMIKAVGEAAQAANADPTMAALGPGGTLIELLKRTQGPTAKKAVEAFKQGRYSEAAGYAGATALPLIGPAAASIGEDIGTGDPEKIGHGIGSLGAMAVLPKVTKVAGDALIGRAPAVAAAADAGAASRLADVMSPKGSSATIKRLGNVAQKIAPDVAREPGLGALSREGLQGKVETKLAEAGDKMDEVAATMDPNKLYDTSPIREGLKEKLKALTSESAGGEGAHEQVAKMGLDMPEKAPAPDTEFKDLPLPYKQELRRIKAELEEVQYQPPTSRNEARAYDPQTYADELQQERTFQPGKAGAPIYWDIMAGKLGTNRQGVIAAISKYIDGDLSSPIAKRALESADRRLRGLDVSDAVLPPDAGFAPEDVAGKIGKDVIPTPNRVQAAQIQKAMSELDRLGPAATYDALRKIRQSYDDLARPVYSPAMTPDYMAKLGEAKGAADVTGVFRGALAEISPEMAEANKSYSLWKKASDVMKSAEETERVKPKVGRKIVARGLGTATGGAVSGGVGAAIGFVLGPIVESALEAGPTTKIMTGRMLADLSDSLKAGDLAKARATLTKLGALTRQSALVNANLPKDDK